MPNVTRGRVMYGLVRYLVGPGRENQHTEPHIVAGSPSIMAWHAGGELSEADAAAITRELDHPYKVFGVDVPSGHVWHASWSVRAEEGRLGDETWTAIAADIAREMGFDGSDGKAPCRWMAVHHGLSTAGNDHIHFVADLVREDGTKWNQWNDRPRAQKLAGQLERTYHLEKTESRDRARGVPGVSPAEQRRAKEAGRSEPERTTLARIVRGCGTAARDEAEFVRRLRREGLEVRPRFAKGRTDVVSGFSVALPPKAGQEPFFLGGSSLGHDLSLPRLRAAWPDTPEQAGAAVAEWAAVKDGRDPVGPASEAEVAEPAAYERASGELAAMRDFVRTVPDEEHGTWSRLAGEVAGAFAAYSRRVEGEVPGPFAEASDSLANTASIRAVASTPRRGPSARQAALLLASVAHGGTGPVAEAVLLRQLVNTARAIHDAHAAVGDARRAQEIAGTFRGPVAAALPPVDAPVVASPTQSGSSFVERSRRGPAERSRDGHER